MSHQFATITKRFTFEAAHHLPQHDGPCRNLHGHSYTLDVSVRGPIRPVSEASDSGMVLDFSALSTVVKRAIIEHWDHRDLNEVTGVYPTCEHLAWLAFTMLAPEVKALGAALSQLRLSETATSWCEIEGDPWP